eukprot:3044183-Pleurochrysis_carterae.AAC.2
MESRNYQNVVRAPPPPQTVHKGEHVDAFLRTSAHARVCVCACVARARRFTDCLSILRFPAFAISGDLLGSICAFVQRYGDSDRMHPGMLE